MSIRFNEDIVSVWNKTATNRDVTERVRDAIKRILRLPNSVHMEYKPHHDSLMDKSSFRNTQVWRPKSLEGRNREEQLHGEGQPGPPRRTGSWGERNDEGRVKHKGRTEVERAWR